MDDKICLMSFIRLILEASSSEDDLNTTFSIILKNVKELIDDNELKLLKKNVKNLVKLFMSSNNVFRREDAKRIETMCEWDILRWKKSSKKEKIDIYKFVKKKVLVPVQIM